MSLPNKLIVFLGRTLSGHNHDYLMLKQELPPHLDWFTDINVRVDLGYLGIQSDYRGDCAVKAASRNVVIPWGVQDKPCHRLTLLVNSKTPWMATLHSTMEGLQTVAVV